MSTVFKDHVSEFDNNGLTDLGSICFSRNPTLDKEFSKKNKVDDELDKNTNLRFF